MRNLLCSVVLRPSLPVEKWARLTHACALAVCEVLESIPDLPAPQIKWPNDIYLSERKVCGILVESTLNAQDGFAVAGAGVNLNLTASDFPGTLRDTATSVWLERGGQPVSREDFAVHFLRRLRAQCIRADTDFSGILMECDSRSFLNGKRITLISAGMVREGTADGLGPEGELRMVTDDGHAELVTSADFVRPTAQRDAAS
jgi:BirA family biotin operon repressor/biotin-[acetyl-CoA-carboxylase] ligase